MLGKHKWLINWNFPIIPETENSNKLLLETFSKWSEIATTTSFWQIRNTHKRRSKIESFKPLKTWFFFTTSSGNLNKFVLQTWSKYYEIYTNWSLHQIRMKLERAQVFELFKLPKTSVFSTATFENFHNFVLWSDSFWPEFFTTQAPYQIRSVCQKLLFLEMFKWGN